MELQIKILIHNRNQTTREFKEAENFNFKISQFCLVTTDNEFKVKA